MQDSNEEKEQHRRIAIILKSMSGAGISGLIDGLSLLYELVGSVEGARAARKAGATCSVVSAMNSRSSNPEVARLGCGYLACSTSIHLDAAGRPYSGAQDAFDAGGVAAVLQALRIHAANGVVAAVGAALCNMLSDSSSTDEVLGLGQRVPAALVAAMHLHPDNVDVAETASRVLVILLGDTRSIGAVIGAGGVAAIYAAARRHPAVRILLGTCSSVMHAISERDLSPGT